MLPTLGVCTPCHLLPNPWDSGPTEGSQAGSVCWAVSISSRMGGLQDEVISRLRTKSRREYQRLGAVWRLPGMGGGALRSDGPGDRPQGRVPESAPLELGRGQSPSRDPFKGTGRDTEDSPGG